MIKIIHFLGDIIIWLGKLISTLSMVLKFGILVTIVLGILLCTLIATTQIISPYPININMHDIWIWIIAVLGWITMVFGVKKLFNSDKELEKTRKSNTLLD